MTCPICGRETEARWRPFCSKRCADIDLGRWVTGSYVLPTDEPAEAEDGVPGADRTDDGQAEDER